ncbi:hypothetical protein DES53_109240 [Roseimicrobium gellanilyticum]|uniref:Uncharacterized protein n=1 Tax=Roseimicrobium gellanilyticum TaxID=748857 RepID=A0A366HBR3_9BACT|nr:hypothetical protein [Roseimicrobium gellanilyticum]RBP39812.1 hypothetical protein DES53_109240 [Roseimicrobium gellanilyticum]
MKKWIVGGVLLCSLATALSLVMPDVSPKAELRVVGTVIRDGVDWYELELTNHTTHELHYMGYEPTDPRFVDLYWEGGEWKELSGYRCGFGLGPQTLAPGTSIRFVTNRPLSTPSRIGVNLRDSSYAYGKVHELEWLPDRLEKWAQDRQKEWLHKRWLETVTWTPPLDPVPYTAAEQLVLEALDDGVVMDLENLFEEDLLAAGPPVGDPFAPAPADPFDPAVGGMAPAPAGSDPFAPAPVSASTSP